MFVRGGHVLDESKRDVVTAPQQQMRDLSTAQAHGTASNNTIVVPIIAYESRPPKNHQAIAVRSQ